MRTYTNIIIIFSFYALSFQSCSNESATSDVVKIENEQAELANPYAMTVAYRPTITIVSGKGDHMNKIVSSSLNHFTSLTVGIHEDQYAVIVKTDTKAANSPTASNNLPPIASQEFADEVEDEIVEETIQVAEAEIVPDELLAVEEGPAAAIPNDLPEEFETKGDASVPTNSLFNAGGIDGAYLLGKFNPATHKDFTKVNKKYASRSGMYVRKDVYQAFLKMYDAALQDGIDLKILSATRSFSGQKRIWEAKWTGKRKVSGQDLSQAIPFGTDRARKILEYSAMPGTSRHHWGTDLDLCALNNAFFEKGKGKEIYDWLNNNARNFGFYQPYTERSSLRATGHNEEKWHWSFLPVSGVLTQMYTQLLSNEKIVGFLGQETAADIQILENYVLGINAECK